MKTLSEKLRDAFLYHRRAYLPGLSIARAALERARAVSHRSRFYVPALNKLSTLLQNFADAEKGSEWKARETDKLRGYVAERILELSDGAAEYLLAHSGSKNAARVAVKMREAARRADEVAAEKKAAQTKAGHLDTASRVSKLAKNEKELVAGLARVFANGKIHEQATALHHAHRAAKAAKRDRQAADVYRVLQLVRAEIKYREAKTARTNANAYASNQIADLRRNLAKLKNADGAFTSCDAERLERAASNIITFPKAKRAAERLAILMLARLKARMIETGTSETFTFDGNEFLRRYAAYLVEYLEAEFKKAREGLN